MALNNLLPHYYSRLRVILTIMISVLITSSTSASINPTTPITDIPYVGSHYIKLSSLDLSNTSHFGTGPKIYPIPLNKIYYKVKSSTIILSSFNSICSYVFGFKISLSVSTDPTTAVNVTVLQTLNSNFSIIGVSVIIVTSPFDSVMKFYEFDMDIENKVNIKPYTRPVLFSIYPYLKSMSQKATYNYFSVRFSFSTSSSSELKLSFYTDYTLDSNSDADIYNVTAVVILVDYTTLYITPQLNFFSATHVQLYYQVFSGYTIFGINTAKYGKDINKKCILGFPQFQYINYNQPLFLFDLDPVIGLMTTNQNNYYDDGDYQSFCMQDLSCPPEYPFKKLNDRIKCWDCTSGLILKQNTIPNCNTYDNAFASVKYDPITGAILRYCLKCLNCDDQFYADNGDCKPCNLAFPNCFTCQENVVCLTCVVGYMMNSVSNCLPCSFFLPNCQECSSQSICTKCAQGYFLEANQCIKCIDKMAFCKSCSSKTYCLECNYPFMLNSDHSECICQKGRILTGTCTEVSGCISSHEINSVTLCYACDTVNNWQFLSSYSCACQKGYSKLNSTYCQNSCGDGLWTEQQCDDGNNLIGDGCSSFCKREEFFQCTNNYLQKSVCRYTPQLISSVYSLSREFGTSRLTLKLQFFPFHPIIMTNNWPSNIFVNSSQILFDSHEFQDNHLLVLHYTIHQSIETQTLNWTLAFDTEKFLSSSTSLTIQMKGMNAPLTYQAHYKHERIIGWISYVVGGLAFAIAIVAMVKADSNIAFETVTTVLFVFYIRILLSSNNPAMLYALSGLRVAEGFNQFFPDEHRDYQEYIMKNRFFIKSQLSLMGMFTLVLLFVILLLKLTFQIKSFFNLITSKKLSIKKNMDSETKEWKTFKFFNKAYNAYISLDKNCFTPVTIILLFKFICMFNAHEDINHRYPSHFSPLITTIITLIFFVVIIYYMAVGASIVSILFHKINPQSTASSHHKHKISLTNHQPTNLYADLYVVYIFVTSVFVFLMTNFRLQSQTIIYGIEGCAGVVLGYLILLLIYRPYEKLFNMVAIVMNEIVKFGFLCFLLLIKKNLLSQLYIMIACYFTLAMLIIIEILSIIRIKLSWTFPKPKQNQTQQLKQVFKLNSKDSEFKQQRLHDIRKEFKKNKKKLWINYEENMYLYQNIVKKENQSSIRKQQAAVDLYEAFSKANRVRRGTKFDNQEIEDENNLGLLGNPKEVSLMDSDKKVGQSELQRIKQRIRMSGYVNRPKEQLYRLK